MRLGLGPPTRFSGPPGSPRRVARCATSCSSTASRRVAAERIRRPLLTPNSRGLRVVTARVSRPGPGPCPNNKPRGEHHDETSLLQTEGSAVRRRSRLFDRTGTPAKPLEGDPQGVGTRPVGRVHLGGPRTPSHARQRAPPRFRLTRSAKPRDSALAGLFLHLRARVALASVAGGAGGGRRRAGGGGWVAGGAGGGPGGLLRRICACAAVVRAVVARQGAQEGSTSSSRWSRMRTKTWHVEPGSTKTGHARSDSLPGVPESWHSMRLRSPVAASFLVEGLGTRWLSFTLHRDPAPLRDRRHLMPPGRTPPSRLFSSSFRLNGSAPAGSKRRRTTAWS